MRQKNFRPKKLRIFFHETTKTPREVFGSHRGESLSSLLVKVAITPPLPSQQAITCSAMPQRGSRAAAIARQRRLWQWQRGGNVQLGSAAAASSLASGLHNAASLLHHWDMAALAATNAVLPPCAASVVMKTPAATAMTGACYENRVLWYLLTVLTYQSHVTSL